MWVRSQDKTFLKDVKEFCVKNNYDVVKDSGNKLKATAFVRVQKEECYIEGDCVVLGEYSTKEKALKVLDMIQELINCSEEYKAQGEYKREIVSGCNEINRLKTFVFQMPQDSEVE